MTETKKENKKLKSGHIELIFISTGIFLIISIWVLFPRYLFWKDSQQPQQTTQIVIPYQLDAMLKTEPTVPKSQDEETEKTRFQAIGDQFGAFGDSYGPLNTLFSGLAFAFLVASLYLQRKELQAQRVEIADQKEEIKRGNDIAEGQRTITEQQANLIQEQIIESQKQNFYSQLFKFLDEKNRKASALTFRYSGEEKRPYSGDEFFKAYSFDLTEALRMPDIGFPPPYADLSTKALLESLILENYKHVSHHRRANFEENLYFEYFIFIFDFIDKNPHHIDINIVVDTFLSYLTKHETLCMALYAVIKNEKLVSYIEKFSLLKKLDVESLDRHVVNGLKNLFTERAFSAAEPEDISFILKKNSP